MTDLRAAAEAALEALEWHLERGAWGADIEGITANLRAALAEPVQEPVAWMFVDDTGMRFVSVERPHKDFQPLYATPIQRLPVAKGLPRKLPEDNDE